MRIPYLVKRGSFLSKFVTWILEYTQELDRGQTITLDLEKPGGYPARDLRIEIVGNDSGFFETDWEYQDWTRFPARVRALATALRDAQLWGRYQVSHSEGEVELTKLSC
jgi:hypothetical protein